MYIDRTPSGRVSWRRMMKAAGSESALELSLDGKPVVVLNHAKLGFSLEG